MMSSNNQMSKEQFINQIGHVRKREMATMIFEGASFEELASNGFGRTNVQEMVAKIKVYVEGMQDFKVGGGVAVVETPTPTDSGSSDSGPSESGSSDSGSSDSGPSESGSSDSGSSASNSTETNPQV